MRLVSVFNIFTITSASLVLLVAGCKDKSDAPTIHRLKGRVLKIDPTSEIVTGMFYVEQQSREMELSGKLAPDAEILINGRTATLRDIHIDDSVEVIGFMEKRDGERALIAKKVEVNRAGPSTQPAGTAPEEPSKPEPQ